EVREQKMPRRERHEEFRARIPPAALKVVCIVLVVIEPNNGMVTREPRRPGRRLCNAPLVVEQHFRGVCQQMTLAFNPEAAPEDYLRLYGAKVLWRGRPRC